MGRAVTGLKKSIATWAKSIGTEHARMEQFGNGGGTPWGYSCAKAIVLGKIHEALGLDQTKGTVMYRY